VNALARWREQLESWAIPPEILAAAPESPYGFPTELFRTRGASDADRAEPTATTLRALERLPEGGRVLDVGCGGGATSLPLAGRAGVLVGVDAQEDMLDGFLANARAAGIPAEAVHGGWPDVSGTISPVDVAVAGHVLYNVADLEPFAHAIAGVAQHRVVLELTERHPLSWMNDLWHEFHGLDRPAGPTCDDAADALREIDLDPEIERWEPTPRGGGFTRRTDALALARRRLCLSPSQDDALAVALGPRLAEREGLWSVGPEDHALATIWFDP
jgi:SAM-dependent methyltransferase